jgi:hypothetical protein
MPKRQKKGVCPKIMRTISDCVITRRNFLKIFPWWHVVSCPKTLRFRTHQNSTTELTSIGNHVIYFCFSPVCRKDKKDGVCPKIMRTSSDCGRPDECSRWFSVTRFDYNGS